MRNSITRGYKLVYLNWREDVEDATREDLQE